MGMASGHLVNLSITVSRCVCPLEAGRGPTMLTWTWANRAVGASNLCNGALVCRWTFAVWQLTQPRAHARTSFARPCHTNLLFMIRTVAPVPGCESPWTRSNTSRRISAGTSGLGFPVDVSHRILCWPLSMAISSHLRAVMDVLYALVSGSCRCRIAILVKSTPCLISSMAALERASATALSAPPPPRRALCRSNTGKCTPGVSIVCGTRVQRFWPSQTWAGDGPWISGNRGPRGSGGSVGRQGTLPVARGRMRYISSLGGATFCWSKPTAPTCRLPLAAVGARRLLLPLTRLWLSLISAPGRGCRSIVALARAVFTTMKALSRSSVHSRCFFGFAAVASYSGFMIMAALARIGCRNWSCPGIGVDPPAWPGAGSRWQLPLSKGIMPDFVTVCPRNSICVFPNWHLLGFTIKSWAASRRKSSRKCSVCSSRDRLAMKYVIHVDEQVVKVAEDFIHHPLEHLSGVFKAERHSKELKGSERRRDGRLWDVFVWLRGFDGSLGWGLPCRSISFRAIEW